MLAKLILPSPASKPGSELLPLLELHITELEEIVWTIAARVRHVFLIRESEIIETDRNIGKINGSPGVVGGVLSSVPEGRP